MRPDPAAVERQGDKGDGRAQETSGEARWCEQRSRSRTRGGRRGFTACLHTHTQVLKAASELEVIHGGDMFLEGLFLFLRHGCLRLRLRT